MAPPRIITKLDRAVKQMHQANDNLRTVWVWAIAHDEHLAIGTYNQLHEAEKVEADLCSMINIVRAQAGSQP